MFFEVCFGMCVICSVSKASTCQPSAKLYGDLCGVDLNVFMETVLLCLYDVFF